MSMPLRLLAVGAAFAIAGTAFATPPATTTKTLTAQQQRMSTCSSQAKGKKGAEYKTFISSCLKGGSTTDVAAATSTAATPTTAKLTQQEKMKTCNAEAKLKAPTGAAHKTFMSSCLKSSAATATN